MIVQNLPSLELGAYRWTGEAPDPLDHPDYYQNVAIRRVAAYLVDLLAIGMILMALTMAFAIAGVFSFGLMYGPLMATLPAVPIAYHTLFLGAAGSATPGMRLFGLEMRTWTGGRPSYIQAAIVTAVFYATVCLTGFVILLVALFNDRRRTLHDFLCGTVIVNAISDDVLLPSAGG